MLNVSTRRKTSLISKWLIIDIRRLEGIVIMNYIVRGDRDSRANLMPIYGDLYHIKL